MKERTRSDNVNSVNGSATESRILSFDFEFLVWAKTKEWILEKPMRRGSGQRIQAENRHNCSRSWGKDTGGGMPFID